MNCLSHGLAKVLVEDFLKNSWSCVEVLVKELANLGSMKERRVDFFSFKNGQRKDVSVEGKRFFLRTSVEYSNPQLTVEEVQGLIAARLLEVCANYFCACGLRQFDGRDVDALCEMLMGEPCKGVVVPFLLNTDETEPDRYSMNPLKESIVNSGQSAFPSAYVKTDGLKIDDKFAVKYDGTLISKGELELIARALDVCKGSYMDMADSVKYTQLESLSEAFGMNLRVYALRMPLATLEREGTDGFLHHVIREVHRDYSAIETVYNCMGRSLKNRTTLLTVPHSKKGYASKRAVRGKIYFDNSKLKNVKVTYKTTALYPNAMDPNDVSVAKAEDEFMVESDRLVNYSFKEVPSSPQFVLYSLASPENAALWHGIGAFGATQLLKSYAAIRLACMRGSLIGGLDKYEVVRGVPLQFNLSPKHMWVHPVHRNIDASIGCVQNFGELAGMGMRIEPLSIMR